MRRDKGDPAILRDMLDAAEAVIRYIAGKDRASFDIDRMLRDAVERRIEIIGEAARRISDPFQKSHPEIPWRKIMGTRHVLAHDYDEVNPDIVWRIATVYLPELAVQLRGVIPSPPPNPDPGE